MSFNTKIEGFHSQYFNFYVQGLLEQSYVPITLLQLIKVTRHDHPGTPTSISSRV